MASPTVISMVNGNNQYVTIGPVKDSSTGELVTDLSITLSLYSGRDISNPVDTPGSLVSAFGTNGSISIPYFSNGLYRILVPAFTVEPGAYVLVIDSPESPAGYQLHRERRLAISTG